jgi:hypothetical protein
VRAFRLFLKKFYKKKVINLPIYSGGKKTEHKGGKIIERNKNF